MHELYLQARRDVIEERIQPKRDAAFELAALALQAEFGNRPPTAVVDYFDNHHYLVKARLFSTKIEFTQVYFQKYCNFEDPRRLQIMLAEMHGHYSGTNTAEAEMKFIQARFIIPP